MKKLVFLCAIAILFSACGVHHALTYNANNSNTNIVLSTNNYKIIQRVEGQATSATVFGIGNFKALVANARADMLKKANLVGKSRAIINEYIEVNKKSIFIVGTKTVTVSAYVIEFTGDIDSDIGQVINEPEVKEKQETVSNLVQITPDGIEFISFCGIDVMTNDLPQKYTWKEAQQACPIGWCLPTVKELRCLCENKEQIGGFKGVEYWSDDFFWDVAISNNFKDCGKKVANRYFIFGIPSCLQILLQRISSISVCRGTAELPKVSGLMYKV
jgi:hypothetical protein